MDVISVTEVGGRGYEGKEEGRVRGGSWFTFLVEIRRTGDTSQRK